jgi:hypothetical protein
MMSCGAEMKSVTLNLNKRVGAFWSLVWSKTSRNDVIMISCAEQQDCGSPAFENETEKRPDASKASGRRPGMTPEGMAGRGNHGLQMATPKQVQSTLETRTLFSRSQNLHKTFHIC